MKSVLFFGASVTAQSTAHNSKAVTGYVDSLVNSFSKSDYKVERVAHGSCQYSNMGIYGLTEAILKSPDIIFFEWHTTGERSLSKNLLLQQFNLLRALNILMILLVLPSKRHVDTEDLQKYKVLHELPMPILDLRWLINAHKGGPLLRDDVHTNETGAFIYAREIDKYIRSELKGTQRQAKITAIHDVIDILPVSSLAILSREIPLECKLYANTSLSLVIDQDSDLIFKLIKGPRSPSVKIFHGESSEFQEVNIIDQWCYYDREACGMEISAKSNIEIVFKPSKQIPDYTSICPKLLEDRYRKRQASMESELFLDLKSVYVPIQASVTIKRM